jgi:hypothetical protein
MADAPSNRQFSVDPKLKESGRSVGRRCWVVLNGTPSHDDECHRPALECSCCSYLSAGNTRQVADRDEIFVMDIGEFSSTV